MEASYEIWQQWITMEAGYARGLWWGQAIMSHNGALQGMLTVTMVDCNGRSHLRIAMEACNHNGWTWRGIAVKLASLPRIRIFLKIAMGRYHPCVFRHEARLAVKMGVILGLGEVGIMTWIWIFINSYFAFFQKIFLNQEAAPSRVSHLSMFCAWLLRVLVIPWFTLSMRWSGLNVLKVRGKGWK